MKCHLDTDKPACCLNFRKIITLHIDNHWLVPRKVSRFPGSSFIELSGGGKRGKKFVNPKQSTIYSYFGTADNDASNSGLAFY